MKKYVVIKRGFDREPYVVSLNSDEELLAHLKATFRVTPEQEVLSVTNVALKTEREDEDDRS